VITGPEGDSAGVARGGQFGDRHPASPFSFAEAATENAGYAGQVSSTPPQAGKLRFAVSQSPNCRSQQCHTDRTAGKSACLSRASLQPAPSPCPLPAGEGKSGAHTAGLLPHPCPSPLLRRGFGEQAGGRGESGAASRALLITAGQGYFADSPSPKATENASYEAQGQQCHTNLPEGRRGIGRTPSAPTRARQGAPLL